MTTEQIQEEVDTALARASVKLQMPPVMKIKEENTKVLSVDPALQNFDDSKYVFTDITYGVPDTDRVMVIRDMDGSLSTAPLEIRKRLNQFYFPTPGRQVRVPKLFASENLRALLDKLEFEFVLDAVCIQFEPYEREFHEISAKVFEYIDEHKEFDSLRSTRHFGPMSFFLAWHNRIDNLLVDVVQRDYLDNGVDLVELTCKLNKWTLPAADKLAAFRDLLSRSESSSIDSSRSSLVDQELEKSVGKSGEQIEAAQIAMEIIREFVQKHALKKVQLELALQTYAERLSEQQKLLQGIKMAHGM